MHHCTRITFLSCIFAVLFLSGCGGSGRGDRIKAAHIEANLLQHIQANGHVKIGVKEDSPPFGYRLAGELIGYDLDIANELMSRLRVDRITWVPVTSANRIDKLLSGEVGFGDRLHDHQPFPR